MKSRESGIDDRLRDCVPRWASRNCCTSYEDWFKEV